MKKIIILLVAALMLALAGCDTTAPDYDWAVLTLPNGVIIQGAVGSWTCACANVVVVEIDGAVYRVDTTDIVLIDTEVGK